VEKRIKYLLYLFLLTISGLSYSQTNLIPNSSFETNTSCPNSTGQIYYAPPWISPTLSSPDYYNACSTGSWSVPNNLFGSENAHSGIAYVGLDAFAVAPGFANSYREYIQTPLNNNLLKGENYCVQFYVSLGDSLSEYAANNIGAYFSTNAISSTNYNVLSYVPQVVNSASNPLTNLTGWTKVSGEFTASGGEQYLTIGNFNDNTTTDTLFIRYPSVTYYGNHESYYYIDDVSVIHIDAEAGKDTAICLGNSITIGRVTSPGLTYSWQPATGLSNSTIAQPIATPTLTTTYYLTASLIGGCSKLDTVTITVVNANAGNDTILCNGSIVTIGSTALTGVNYNWLPATDLNSTTIAQPTVTPNTTTTYTVTASANGCTKSDKVIVTVLPYQTPIANAGTSKTLCLGDTINIGSSATAGFTYAWSPINYLSNADGSNPFAFPKQTTLYTLIVTDTASGYLCKTSGTDSILITIDQCPPEIPNVFTPNNDGVNDDFVITNLAEGSSVTIYDRWGIVVFQLTASQQQIIQWDGKTTSGQACVDGVCFYIVRLGNGEIYKGSLELLR
jgi:gliding motility-associated-like protein